MAKALRRLLLLAVSGLAVVLLGEAVYRATLHLGAPATGTAAHQFELYGVGESTMVGEPFEPKISVPRLLEHLFGHALAGRTIVVRNLAERGVPLYPQSIAFEQAVAFRDPSVPGVALIMSGHNEGFTPATPDGRRASALTEMSEGSALVRDAVLALRRHRAIGREKSLAMYEHYLRRVIETAQRKGLVPILTTMASNIARIEPNYEGSDGYAVGAVVEHGMRLEAEGRYREARDLYVSNIAGHANASASLYYRAGHCEEALGDFAAAREDYWTAVDLDPRTSFGRATRPQNDLLRRLAREYRIPLVDAVEIFEARSPHGLLGNELFMDGQHPSIEGYRLLADAYARILTDRFNQPIANPLRDEREVAAAVGFGPEDVSGSLVDAGSWLIATSVNHPFPRDRMALAAKHFATLDDFSAWMGIALTQAALRGGMLRSPADLLTLGNWGGYTKSYRNVPSTNLPPLLVTFQKCGVDADVIDRLRALAPGTPAAAMPQPGG